MAITEDTPGQHTSLWWRLTVQVHRHIPGMSADDRVRLSIEPFESYLLDRETVDRLIADLQEARSMLVVTQEAKDQP